MSQPALFPVIAGKLIADIFFGEKMKILTGLFLSFLLYVNIFSGVIIDSTDSKIIDNTLNNNFEVADSLLKIKLSSNPDDIKYHFFQLNNNSFKSIAQVSTAKKSERREIREALNQEIIEYGVVSLAGHTWSHQDVYLRDNAGDE